nr:hypothetical protein GCM10020241_43710 [Streptoalloteichus tenebrarius]
MPHDLLHGSGDGGGSGSPRHRRPRPAVGAGRAGGGAADGCAPRASFERFLAGEPKPEDHNSDWHEIVRSYVAAGKSIGRVRVVRRPLTDYQRYQLAWGIPGNIAAGEDIRVVDITDDDWGLPDQDFWLFDQSTVVHLNFAPDGALRDIELVDNPDLDRYLNWRDTALKNAVSYEKYVRTCRESP